MDKKLSQKSRTAKIKICGLSRLAEIDCANTLGIDAVGFVCFVNKSPRKVPIERARELCNHLGESIKPVILAVDPTSEQLKTMCALGFKTLQLHGRETRDQLKMIKDHYDFEIWKAFSISRRADLDHIEAYADLIDSALLDAKPPNDALREGGLGISFDWRLLENWTTPTKLTDNCWLAGGLTPLNVQGAILGSKFPGVDVSSGVESSPGVKDPQRMKSFVDAVRSTPVVT